MSRLKFIESLNVSQFFAKSASRRIYKVKLLQLHLIFSDIPLQLLLFKKLSLSPLSKKYWVMTVSLQLPFTSTLQMLMSSKSLRKNGKWYFFLLFFINQPLTTGQFFDHGLSCREQRAAGAVQVKRKRHFLIVPKASSKNRIPV